MIDDERAVALVPARGGSKGIEGKNLRELGGKPLVAWSIDVAGETDAVDRVVVSTDDADIAATAREYGADVIDRPAALAADDSLVVDAVRHARSELRAAGESAPYMVLLEPTCPFRSPDDVAACLARLVERDLDAVATFVPAELNPHRAWRIEDGRPAPFVDGVDPWSPRQELPAAHQLNGGAYAFVLDALPDDGHALLFGAIGAVEMPPKRSVDIDTPVDLTVARTLVAEGLVGTAAESRAGATRHGDDPRSTDANAPGDDT